MTVEWSEDLVTDICDHLSTGKSLIEIGSLQGYPSTASMYRQMSKDAAFATRIARAREAQQDYEADNIVRMADQATGENWQVVKLQIYARQWRAAKLAPKRYGDRLAVDATVTDKRAVEMSEEELLAIASGSRQGTP